MTHRKSSPAWLQIAAVALCLPLASFAADIRGKITTVTPAGTAKTGGSVRIEGTVEKDTTVDKAATRITAQTKILKLENGKKTAQTFNDLKVGQSVEATFTGPVAESYPVQATAGEIIILADAPAKPAKPAAPDNEPVVKEGAELTLSGKLQGGMMGIGGESTGWMLNYQAKAGARSIEVDCSALVADKIPEGAVRVTGKVILKNYVERGPTLILKAAKVEKQP